MINEFILNAEEDGFIIVISDNTDNKIKYIGKEDTVVITDKPLAQYIENQCLDSLVLYSDEDGICEAINKYREKGINARMYSVFKDTGHRILDYDETEKYIKYKLITDI